MVINDAVWLDTNGQPIQAHAGSLLEDARRYYWYGENKDGPTVEAYLHRVDFIGISCYSSSDLFHWTPHGLALSAVHGDPQHDLHPSKVGERPKVLRCPRTGKYLMWLHIDRQDYSFARVGVAVSDSPSGPFVYRGSFQPSGLESRDFTLFQDEDGSAYLYFSSDWNQTLRGVRLSDDYTTVQGEAVDVFKERAREAPAVFRQGEHYFMLTSGCTGWDPNPAQFAVAPHPLGPWEVRGNPCVGTDAEITFGVQPTFALPITPETTLVMFDRWKKEDLRDSRYVWLSASVQGSTLSLRWQPTWAWPEAQGVVQTEVHSRV